MSDSEPEKEGKSSDHHHHHHHHKESHGLRDDIDEKTPLDDVKAPNVFERAKEEVEALIQTINPKNQSSTHGTREDCENESHKQEKRSDCVEVKTPKFIDKATDPFEKLKHDEKNSPRHPRHHKETHGRSDDIDENTPIDEIKAPSIFERAKEEIEAVFRAIFPKKDR